MGVLKVSKFNLYETLEKSPTFSKVPKELSDIIHLLQKPQDVEIENLIEKIELVDGLPAMIIDFINSDLFKIRKEVTSLKEAIIYLGMNTVQVIAILAIISTLFPNYLNQIGNFRRECYLRHSVGTAVASVAIAEWLGKGDKYQLFAYGLLHDIGVVLYESYFPELKEKIDEIIIRGNHQIVAERIVLGGIDHTDIGEWLCDKLILPPNIRQVITAHHWPFKAKEDNIMIKILNLGDYISTKYYEDLLRRSSFEWPTNYNLNNSLNVPKEVIEEIANSLPKKVDEVLIKYGRWRGILNISRACY